MPERAVSASGEAPGAAFDELATSTSSPSGQAAVGAQMSLNSAPEAWHLGASDEREWLDELECARIDCAGAFRRATEDIERTQSLDPEAARVRAERDYGTGATAQDSIAKAREWAAEAKAELPLIEDEIFEEVDHLWAELFPGEGLFWHRSIYSRLAHERMKVGEASLRLPDDDPIEELFERCWEDIYRFGFERISAGVGADVFIAMRGSLGIGGVMRLLRALRRGDKATSDQIVARITAYDKHYARGWYNRVRVILTSGGELRVVVDQRLARCGHSPEYDRRRRGFRRHFRGARSRRSRGRSFRSAGSRRGGGKGGGGPSDDGGDGSGQTAGLGLALHGGFDA